MNADQHIDVEDLAMFAMLPDSVEQEPEFASHLETCGVCRAELKQVHEDLAWYALATEPVALPGGARERFLAKLDEAPRQAAVEPLHAAPALRPVLVERKRSFAEAVLPWVGWAVAAAAVFMVFGLRQERASLQHALHSERAESARLALQSAETGRILDALRDPRAVRVSLTQPKAPALPAARASYDQHYGTLLMQASNLAPLQQNKVYELWVIPSNGAAPIPAGVFTPDAQGNATLIASKLPQGIQAKAFGITVEHAGGSATPTMPILLAGAPG